MFVTHNFLEDMALVMCVAALATIICRFLRQPVVVGYLIAGMVLGPHIPGLYANMHRVRHVAELGVTLLIFSIGLEFKFRRLMRLAPTAGLVALIQVAAMIGLGYLAGQLLGWTPWESLLCGATVAISGAVVVVKVFEVTQADARVRELVFGVVLCEDVIAILLLAVLITIANGGAMSLVELWNQARLLTSFIVAVVALGFFTVPPLLRRIARFKRPETLLIVSLGLCFGFAVIAERAGYSVALGAFLAGSLVAESGEGETVAKLVEPVRHIFGALFFVAVGMLIDPDQLAAHWVALVALTSVVLAGKIASVFLASIAIGERPATAVKSGFAMAQIGVFALLIAEVPAGDAAVGSFLYSLAAGVAAITSFLCPLMIRASDPAARWLDRHLPMPVQRALAQYGARLHPARQQYDETPGA
ncbi:MAG TPA: cation:proton antiporter [Candidatus Udaeobacter sp.]|nr:cation:proton antiporter [Candidatus Udaeobacter sp.]